LPPTHVINLIMWMWEAHRGGLTAAMAVSGGVRW
jgi:hypothetical protein